MAVFDPLHQIFTGTVLTVQANDIITNNGVTLSGTFTILVRHAGVTLQSDGTYVQDAVLEMTSTLTAGP